MTQGYRRIATIAGRQSQTAGLERLEGYRRALAFYGLAVPEGYIRYGDFVMEGATTNAMPSCGSTPMLKPCLWSATSWVLKPLVPLRNWGCAYRKMCHLRVRRFSDS